MQPSGKWNVKIRLTANSDVDVQLYDLDDTSTYSEGKAIVAWCEEPCNIGALGSSESEAYTRYESMKIGYSGYYGVNGQYGKEWISVQGETSRRIAMYAFAFETGVAFVEYEWDRVQTACCLGVAACGGSFSQTIAKDQTVDIGEIPLDKKNLRVELSAGRDDVDIQLFDLDDTTCASQGGQAIIAYSSETSGCGVGVLGNNDGNEESTTYQGLQYKYSGYFGGGTAATYVGSSTFICNNSIPQQQRTIHSYGDEWIQLQGNTNRRLMMKAYGYAAGEASVTYSYYEDYDIGFDARIPSTPSIDWLVSQNRKSHKTNSFVGDDNLLIVRRASSFTYVVSAGRNSSIVSVKTSLKGVVEDNSNDSLNSDSAAYPVSKISCESVVEGNTRYTVTCALSSDAPIGSYTLTSELQYADASTGRPVYQVSETKRIVILVNPYASKDNAYVTSSSNRAEYVEMTEGLVWQGLSDNNDGYLWSYDQYNVSNLEVALKSIRRMPIADRGDLTYVTRHLSYSVGADICYGKWGEGSYTTGRPAGGYRCSDTETVAGSKGRCVEPDKWTNTNDVFQLHMEVQKPVQYCQCFVYAALMTSIGRSLGIATRPVSTFQSAHDTERNRAIDKFYEIQGESWAPIKDEAPTTDSVWSFHVWNDFYFKRPELSSRCAEFGIARSKTCANGWQSVDATPQELSVGGRGVDSTAALYQMGPASVGLIKSNKDPTCGGDAKYGCFDGEFVISEVNANVNLWIRTPENQTWRRYGPSSGYTTDPFGDEYNTIGLQISTKKKGEISDTCRRTDDQHDCSAELDDVTKYYKSTEPSGPGTPTDPSAGPDTSSTNRARRLRRVLTSDISDTSSDSLSIMMGLNPSSRSVLVNEDHHPASFMTLTVPIRNNHSSDVFNVSCHFESYAVDYRNAPISNSSYDLSRVSRETIDSVVLNPGNETTCLHTIEREHYRRFAATYLDSDLVEMDEGEKAFAVHVTVSVTSTNVATNVISLFELEHSKTICTPKIGLSTRSGHIRCEGNRGSYHPDDDHDDPSSPLYHLTSGQRDCSALSVNSHTVNNGVCNPGNNVDNCWDGGDCCAYSCFHFNGGLVTTDNDGNVIPNHECFLLNDTATCLDPTLRGFTPPPDYGKPPTPVAFNATGGAEDFGVSRCDELMEAFNSSVFSSCDADPCSTECKEAVNEQVCELDHMAALESQCLNDLMNSTYFQSCNKPRCTSRRTLHGCRCYQHWSYPFFKVGTINVTGGRCANYELAWDQFHYNDWCFVVPDSCNTNLPGTFWDSDVNEWWDDCASGQTSTTTSNATPALPILYNTIKWSDEELELVDPQSGNTSISWSLISGTPQIVDTGDDDDDNDGENTSNSDGLSDATIIGIVVGSVVGIVVLGIIGMFVMKAGMIRK